VGKSEPDPPGSAESGVQSAEWETEKLGLDSAVASVQCFGHPALRYEGPDDRAHT
jgi:hypothetical protein